MSRIKILTTHVIVAITLFLISGCSSTENQPAMNDLPYNLTDGTSDELPILCGMEVENEAIRHEKPSYNEAQEEFYHTTNLPPQLWPLPQVEISDFGRQVAEEFLYQFESLFAKHLYSARHLWIEEGIFWWGDRDVWIDRFGNEVVPDEVPFIKGDSSRFIALYFQLFDLNYDGIPEIVITFVFNTTHRDFLYMFIDGQYREVASDISGFRFFYDQNHTMLAMTGVGAFLYFRFDGENVHLDYAFMPNWSNLGRPIDWEASYGLIEIPPLTDLEEAIRKSVLMTYGITGSELAPRPEPTTVSILDLVGVWDLCHATDETGEDIQLPYTDWLPWTLEIRADSTFIWTVYGRRYGNLIYAGDGSFTAINMVAWAEGDTWHPDDEEITILYAPQSGLLRFTRIVAYEDFFLKQIIYYARK